MRSEHIKRSKINANSHMYYLTYSVALNPPPASDPNCQTWQMNYDKHVQKSINKISKIYTKYTQID